MDVRCISQGQLVRLSWNKKLSYRVSTDQIVDPLAVYRRPRVMLSWRSYAIGSFATLTVALGLGAAREGVNLSVESIADDVLTNPVKIIIVANCIAVVIGVVFFLVSGSLFGKLSKDEGLLLQEKALNFILLKLVFSAAMLGVQFNVEALLWACWVGSLILVEILAALGRRRTEIIEAHGSSLVGLPRNQLGSVMINSAAIVSVMACMVYVTFDLLGDAKPQVAMYLALDCAHATMIASHSLIKALVMSVCTKADTDARTSGSSPMVMLVLDASVDCFTLCLGLLQDWTSVQLGLAERGVGVLHVGLMWLAVSRVWAMVSKMGDYARHVQVLGALSDANSRWERVGSGSVTPCGITQLLPEQHGARGVDGGEGDAVSPMVRTQCGHVFLRHRLVQWLKIRASNGACPVCGIDVVFRTDRCVGRGSTDVQPGAQVRRDGDDRAILDGRWPDGIRVPPADASLGHADALLLRLDSRPSRAGGEGPGTGNRGIGGDTSGTRAAGAGTGLLGIPSFSLSVVTGGAFGLRTEVGPVPRGGIGMAALLGRGDGQQGVGNDREDAADQNLRRVLEVAPHAAADAIRQRLQAGTSVGAVVEEALAGTLPRASTAELQARHAAAASENRPVRGVPESASGGGAGTATLGGAIESNWPGSIREASEALRSPVPRRKVALGSEQDPMADWLLSRARARFALRRSRAVVA